MGKLPRFLWIHTRATNRKFLSDSVGRNTDANFPRASLDPAGGRPDEMLFFLNHKR